MCKKITVKDKNYQLHYEIDIVSKRNYRWLVSHPRHLLESCEANINFHLALDVDKVLRHMRKCVTKCEHGMTKCIASMMRRMIRKPISDGLSAPMALQRVMEKTMGQRILSKQETNHLILSLPMVSCSHVFARMNLDDNKHLINMQNTDNEISNMVASNTSHENNASGNNTSGNNTVGDTAFTKMRTTM